MGILTPQRNDFRLFLETNIKSTKRDLKPCSSLGPYNCQNQEETLQNILAGFINETFQTASSI